MQIIVKLYQDEKCNVELDPDTEISSGATVYLKALGNAGQATITVTSVGLDSEGQAKVTNCDITIVEHDSEDDEKEEDTDHHESNNNDDTSSITNDDDNSYDENGSESEADSSKSKQSSESSGPATGDEAKIYLYAIIALSSAAYITVVSKFYKSKNK